MKGIDSNKNDFKLSGKNNSQVSPKQITKITSKDIKIHPSAPKDENRAEIGNDHISLKKRKKTHKRRFQSSECGNCGQFGHVYKYCPMPTISCGIIAIQPFSNHSNSAFKIHELESLSSNDDIRFLLIRRKDTIAYVDFIRGKYNYRSQEDIKYLKETLSAMTPHERKKISDYDFDYLWNSLWSGHNISFHGIEFDRAKRSFRHLRDGFYVDHVLYNIHSLLNSTESTRLTPAWGFPKGRRNMGESDKDCAIREFKEETGYNLDNFVLVDSPPIIESYVGSNGKKYEHRYFLATFNNKVQRPHINKQDHKQSGEIGNIAWLNYEESAILLAEQPHKIQILSEIQNNIINAKKEYSLQTSS